MAKEVENVETIESRINKTTASQKLDEKARQQKKKKAKQKAFKILLIAMILFLVNVYFILAIFYRGENFTVTLDSEYGRESGLVIYEEQSKPYYRTYLVSKDIEFFTDISIDWLPKNIHNEADGSHNGRNYIAYTFYAANLGQDTINYWAKIEIDDVIRDVDEAIRVMVFKNDNKVVYAKNSSKTGQPEPDTVAFRDEDTVMLELTENFEVGDVDKYTVVIWVEGDDPECKDNLIGGEIKMHMTLTEEHILQDKNYN